jgi:uncharacterized membrane protein YtjA (UPF0391 family)
VIDEGDASGQVKAGEPTPAGAVKDSNDGEKMLEWILVALLIAAVASLLGFRGVAGVAATVAHLLIVVLLIGLVLMLIFGVLAIA